MDFLSIVLEILGWILDAFLFSADVYSWRKGKPNRASRRAAKAAGTWPIPPRDPWNRRVILFSITVIALTLTLIVWT